MILSGQQISEWKLHQFSLEISLAGMRVLHFEEWQGVRPARLNPREAKNDTASSHHCLQQMPEPGAVQITPNILQI